MKTFDDIHINRPTLAEGYLALLKAQPGRPIALFAPRRIGKTYFLKNDLTPYAHKAGFLTIYADLWLNRELPLQAINYALEEALDDVTVPSGRAGKIASTPIKGLAGVVEFGEEPKRRLLPEVAELRFDALITRIAKASGKRILLMLDEIQALAETPTGNSVIATIRAVLSNRQHEVCAVFTGSSQHALSQMMSTIGAPMYQFAQLIDFPYLEDEYLQLLINHFNKVHPDKHIELNLLRQAYHYVGYKPALIKDLIKEMSAEGITNVDVALQKFMENEKQIAGWQANYEAQSLLEQAVLFALAHGLPPMAKETIARLIRATGTKVTIAKVRYALEKLKKGGILAKQVTGNYGIEDKLFAGYIAKNYPLKALLIQENERQQIALEKQKKILDITRQVAHDINSPLAALDVIVRLCDELPENKRMALEKASGSILDLAHQLLTSYRQQEDSPSSEMDRTNNF